MIQIRQATIDDVSILQGLDQEVFIDNLQYDNDLNMDWAITEPGEKYFTDLVSKPQSAAFIAFDDDEAVGYIALINEKLSYRKSSYVEIENMGVNPTHRSQGIGTMLLQKALDWCREHTIKKVGVNSYFHNTRAVAFYKKNGFNEIDITLEQDL